MDNIYRESGITGMAGSSVSLTARRAAALRLEPLKRPEISLDIATTPQLSISKVTKSLDIGFTDLTYTVKTGILKRGNRNILKQISGQFQAGDLTAIMGPSGAGKSSLVDILAGYKDSGITGSVTINNCEREPKRFRRQSCLIMQDDKLQPLLTVQEAMNVAANLKLGSQMTFEEKEIRIKHILESIGLYTSRKTRTGQLSGGQRKRLAIALELVNNPPVMFFDEPTSGLDSSTSKQCVSLLKQLAQEGRTIICTIHQPSALLFEMFDHLYVLADGQCIYQGGTKGLVPFLAELNLDCPPYHNPSDYLLEISTNDFGNHNPSLVAKIENGKNNDWKKSHRDTRQCHTLARVEQMMASGLMTPVRAPQIALETPIVIDSKCSSKNDEMLYIDPGGCSNWCKRDERYPTSFFTQFYLLLKRTFVILSRDKSLTLTRILMHMAIAPMIGSLYNGIGNDAAYIFDNFNYAFFSIMFLMFTAFNSMLLTLPQEMPIIIREHFNRWYAVKSYYLAVTIADIPVQITCTLIYTLITYYMTSQPVEWFRLSLFTISCLLTSFAAQSFGLLTGSIFSVQNGVIFGPLCICPFLIFSGFFIHLSDAHPVMRWLFHISFLKYGLEGVMLALFGYERNKLECSDDYCHFIWPNKFLDQIDMRHAQYEYGILVLFFMCVFIRLLSYYILLYRIRHSR